MKKALRAFFIHCTISSGAALPRKRRAGAAHTAQASGSRRPRSGAALPR